MTIRWEGLSARHYESIENDINRMVILNLVQNLKNFERACLLCTESVQRCMSFATFSITNVHHVTPCRSDPETLLKFLHARYFQAIVLVGLVAFKLF